MTGKNANPRTTDTEQDWADEGRPIGSPNDPDIGKARDQTTGPGGQGLRKPDADTFDPPEVARRKRSQ